MVLSFVRAVAVFTAATVAALLCSGFSLKGEDSFLKNPKDSAFLLMKKTKGFVGPVILAIITFIVRYNTPKVKGLAWGYPFAFEIIMMALIVILMIWWHADGSNWKELICFTFLSVEFYLSAASNAETVAIRLSYRKHPLVASFLKDLPVMLFVISLAFFIIDASYFYVKIKALEEEEKERLKKEPKKEPERNPAEDEALRKKFEELMQCLDEPKKKSESAEDEELRKNLKKILKLLNNPGEGSGT